ncbi:nuclear receptor-binding protein-like [Lytechinus pictus]|uniref:nuclear receptor-binding protein-like n=1 Tax=Lytechinus variegatus TaxID=7654 RepID=UPI001BB1ED0D|nr:nuclear receptor-binding protein-like [Lytechinus variegatus]
MPTTGGNDERTGSPRDSGDESEDEREILEESPCGRWQKRRVKVTQRDVPGIDVAYLAMDMEEGREVVWNEVQFSARRDFKAQEDKIQVVFDNLIQLEHPNIVKFYKYWTDTKSDREKPRVIFITEYMSSGSLKQFLKRIKKDKRNIQEKSWRRWCTQILSALSYLHSCDPPIIHGNLTTDTVFIQHNGLIKIGSVAPDAINNHVKTYTEEQRNMHYIAPEYGDGNVSVAADIYAFGICALEMAVLEIQGNGDSRHISRQAIRNAVDMVDDIVQKDFLHRALDDVQRRPTARDLLLHPVLFEVHSLKLLAAHSFVKNESFLQEHLSDKEQNKVQKDDVIATIRLQGQAEEVQWRVSQVPALELEKFLEEVRNGIHPLTAFAMKRSYPVKIRPQSPETQESVKSATPEPIDMENRKITMMQCDVRQGKEGEESPTNLHLELLLRLDDTMNRQLSCEITAEESPRVLANELVQYGFISDFDKDKVAGIIEEKVNTVIQGAIAIAT